ncbi:probable glycosyltransferase At5g03795 [Salvia hispanica]|uniref:probable glycosyltransferase At5g03795 n=1 Tax=Salvia hispanica TaxID=49212 RepID=UPI00200992BE|nr:probable glycosyltransferase At5g03795 [Salvia hispanica]
MLPSRKSHWSSYFSISPSALAFILLTPLLLISFIAFDLGPHKSLATSFSWKSLGFLSSFEFNSSYNTHNDHENSNLNKVSDAIVLRGRGPAQSNLLRKEESSLPNRDLSNAEARGFVNGGLHRRYSRLEKNEAVLAKARLLIREAATNRSLVPSIVEHDSHYVPRGPIYRNPNAFHRSYIEMENVFKVYVYEEGEAPVFHGGPCRSIYSSEGRFIHEIEKGGRFRTKDPEEAHVYFMPFSVVAMVQYLYEPESFDITPIGTTLVDYVQTISHKHPFWNRSLGADHFMLSCHDWGPHSSSYVPLMYNNSIRVLCNANTSEGFNPLKDVTLPEINLKTGEVTGLLGGPPAKERSILAFFAGGLHGHIRHLLLEQWEGRDADVRVYQKLPDNLSYETMLRNSKFCLCPSGYEVASPRVVEAIYSECVPVLISKSYVPPFSDVLKWNKFAVVIDVDDIGKIKEILSGISEAKYLKMQQRVKQVQRHFVVNPTPERFDLFHMILHSVWLRRLNLKLRRSI